MTAKEEASSLLSNLEGTVIAELRSLLDWAKNYSISCDPLNPQFGGLNFTLSLLFECISSSD
jgi:hypothetical protein